MTAFGSVVAVVNVEVLLETYLRWLIVGGFWIAGAVGAVTVVYACHAFVTGKDEGSIGRLLGGSALLLFLSFALHAIDTSPAWLPSAEQVDQAVQAFGRAVSWTDIMVFWIFIMVLSGATVGVRCRR